MALLENLVIVFLAGLATALATGLGVLPFFLVDDLSPRANVVLWGVASGIMVAASLFGLIDEGLAEGTPGQILAGMAVGVVLVIVAHDVLMNAHIDPRDYEEADFATLILILGVLTVHSFPEGVAVGVAFADLNLGTGVAILGATVPLLAIFMTVAISIHNIPEGTAIAIPLRSMGVSEPRMVWWAVFSSLPQPVGAVLAYGFVRVARQFLPFGFGFAAGAMIYLVFSEFLPEALETGEGLPRSGAGEYVLGFGGGALAMAPLLTI